MGPPISATSNILPGSKVLCLSLFDRIATAIDIRIKPLDSFSSVLDSWRSWSRRYLNRLIPYPATCSCLACLKVAYPSVAV
ncbi:hypothetical protein CBS147332_9421 [Penicillium roqueforti]|nr:hypothetical protein CBS147332_9421 [Penicillium roqueforti]KAI3097287.1 hypothetical protein CBS147331_9023 [Penicillium roqueforti]